MIKDDTLYLRHILDAISRIEEYVGDMDHEAFMGTTLVQDGVIRQFEIIGEATKKSLFGNEGTISRHPLGRYCGYA